MGDRILAPGEWAVLALLCEQPAHGWALARQLADSGELGRIWSRSRPLVYRSLEILQARGLIAASRQEPGARGPNRIVFCATAAAHAAVADWLSRPVDDDPEGRSLLLLKLVLIERAGVDPQPLLLAQRESLAATIASLETGACASSGVDRIVLRFRLESTRALLRFVEEVANERQPAAGSV